MVSIFDVAQYILSKNLCGMTSMKIQKLCFYTQAAHLAWVGKPLFDEQFQAWNNGPTNPELHRAPHSTHKSEPKDPNQHSDSHKLMLTEEAIINAVIEAFGSYTAEDLRDISKAQEPYVRAARQSSTTIISHESMMDFYKRMWA